jgi:hypothetical protein
MKDVIFQNKLPINDGSIAIGQLAHVLELLHNKEQFLLLLSNNPYLRVKK